MRRLPGRAPVLDGLGLAPAADPADHASIVVMSAKVTLLPSARRLVDSLRDIGYDFPPAVADIVDNSVSAGSTEIRSSSTSMAPIVD